MSTKNIIRTSGSRESSKRIISKPYKEIITISDDNKNVDDANKIAITTVNNAFVKGSQTKYSGAFSGTKYEKIFNDNKIFRDNDIPRTAKELLMLKGVGSATAKKILKALK